MIVERRTTGSQDCAKGQACPGLFQFGLAREGDDGRFRSFGGGYVFRVFSSGLVRRRRAQQRGGWSGERGLGILGGLRDDKGAAWEKRAQEGLTEPGGDCRTGAVRHGAGAAGGRAGEGGRRGSGRGAFLADSGFRVVVLDGAGLGRMKSGEEPAAGWDS